MDTAVTKDRRFFEFMLICIVLGMSYVSALLGGQKLLALILFVLPIILSGYYLGRTSACILSLLAVLAVTIVTALDPAALSATITPMIGIMALAVWAAVLALTAILVGTLCDERASALTELHESYVGVVEVLSEYLQGGQPQSKSRSTWVAELSQYVAKELGLSRKQVDDVRVAALLHDIGDVEITTKLITRAVNTLESSSRSPRTHTFPGLDLVHSLGSVLHGAVPLLIGQDGYVESQATSLEDMPTIDPPLGAQIIRAVRAYDALAAGAEAGCNQDTAKAVIAELRHDSEYALIVLDALERVALHSSETKPEPAIA